MNQEYDNTNRGTLFRNEYKEKEKQPDYKGKLNVEGTDWELAGWKKSSAKTGKSFISISIQPPREKKESNNF